MNVNIIMACNTFWVSIRFKESDAFVGYQKDVAAAVVFQASIQLRNRCKRVRSGCQQLWESALLGLCTPDELAMEQEGSDTWKKVVCELC